MKNSVLFRCLSLVGILFLPLFVVAQVAIQGMVKDKITNEGLTGAAVLVEGTTIGTTADIDGNYKINNLTPGKYVLLVRYVSYNKQRIENVIVEKDKTTLQNIEMDDAAVSLSTVQVVAQKRTDTDLSMLKSVRASLQVVSGISSQQIGKTQDRDASEVVKRVPGVTIQDNRFIVVRGLNQRYNNVWLNNAATPSSETDVKAFSFDAIPSSMIDNLLIFKSGSPELPAEATGGFVKISTKNIPDENFLTVEYGIGYNDKTTFKDGYHLPSTKLDFLGFGSAARSVPSSFPSDLNNVNPTQLDAAALQLRNNWVAKPSNTLPNQKFAIAFGKKWSLKNEAKLGTITSVNFSNNYSTRSNMDNNAYEQFDATTETPVFLYKYQANIYSKDFKLGLMNNWAYQTKRGTLYEFKNIFNQIGVDKTANTEGWNNYRQGNFKYFSNQYSSRTTYSGQFSGKYALSEKKESKLDWNAGFAYANRIEPDRQNWSMKLNNQGKYEYMIPTVASINELGRLYMKNNEYVTTAAINYEQKLNIGTIKSTVKSGAYGEYKMRDFSERSLCYRKLDNGFLGDDALNALPFETLFTEQYLGQNKVFIIEEKTDLANKYTAKNLLSAAYLSLNLPLGALNIYGGVRAEYNRLMLNGYYDASRPVNKDEPTFNLFPSVNISYNLTKKSLLRFAYASTINRPEFREVSPLSYYDFTEKYSIKGNPELKDAKIQNIDVRFENYPSPTETFSLAAFYKRFTNPIEMVSVGEGSDFSFQNAIGATNYGLELEVKKSLETIIGLRNFSLGLNASYIFSEVEFANSQSERSRPLQGQSPFVVNASLFYQNDKLGLSSSLMYNIMGKRIMVAAELNQGGVRNPDIYELSRHVVDFSINKKMGKHLEFKLGVKDLLAQNVVTQQTYEYVKDGVTKSAKQTNKLYNLGRTFNLGASWKF